MTTGAPAAWAACSSDRAALRLDADYDAGLAGRGEKRVEARSHPLPRPGALVIRVVSPSVRNPRAGAYRHGGGADRRGQADHLHGCLI
jgi:hypothetical protein